MENLKEVLEKKREDLKDLNKTKILQIKDDEIIFDAHSSTIIDFLNKNNLIRKFLSQIQGEEKKITFTQINNLAEKETSLIDEKIIKPAKMTQNVILNLDKTVVIGDFNRKIIEIIERTLNGEKI